MADEKVYFGARQNGKSFVQSEIQEDHKGDIVGWLRRREGYVLVGIPGKLAGEIADYIEALQKQVDEASEVYIDERGTTWNRPTAWSYAQVCKALQRANQYL